MLPGKLRVFSGMQVAPTYSIKHRHYRATILHYIVGGLNQKFLPQISGIVIFEYTDWGKSMARQKGSRTGRCQGCNHLERVRIERFAGGGCIDQGIGAKIRDRLSRPAPGQAAFWRPAMVLPRPIREDITPHRKPRSLKLFHTWMQYEDWR